MMTVHNQSPGVCAWRGRGTSEHSTVCDCPGRRPWSQPWVGGSRKVNQDRKGLSLWRILKAGFWSITVDRGQR